jgi:hypothetical protein
MKQSIITARAAVTVAVAAVAAAVALSPAALRAQSDKPADILVSGDRMHRSYNAVGQRIHVRGTNHEIAWSGYSPLLRVTGSNNRVRGDAARIIIVSGRNNTVYGQRRYNGRRPRVSVSGTNNRVVEGDGSR